MLDWPEQTHTSPTPMLVSVILLALPITTSSRPAEARNGPNVTRQRPSLSACVFADLPANLTVTGSPGDDVPHTGISFSRCKTISSPKIPAKRTSAPTTDANTRTTTSRTMPRLYLLHN